MPRLAQELGIDESLVRRLPLPLAQLYRRAHNAKTPLERHQTAYFLWEAALKLLASVAIVEYAELQDHDPALAERLQNLARPSIGHWWEFARRLTPVLAEAGDAGFQRVRQVLLGPNREDLPLAAGLDAVLRQQLDGSGGARTTVCVTELFDRLVHYRNRELGHGAAGRRAEAEYERLGRALLAGVADVLGRLDVLAGRRLLCVSEVRREPSGGWLIQRYELAGETARRIESLGVPDAASAHLPRPQRVYLVPAPEAGDPARWRSLRPLVPYDDERGEAFFLNCQRGRRPADYLGYTSGATIKQEAWLTDQQHLLARILNIAIDDRALAAWTARSQAEEPDSDGEPTAAAARTLGDFELLSRMGQGGMGVVYRAWQPSLGRQVAVKRLLRVGDPQAQARFAREIHALGRVDHPNLIKIFTSGSEGDEWFFAMELVDGADLADDAEGRLTRTRQFVGTLRYASPEQVLMVPLDRRTDVYSLGATLWELPVLQPLFGASERMPTPDLMLKIQSTDPAPARQLNPHVPPDLDAIVQKCLEKDRARRYATAAELAADLQRFQDGRPVRARPVGTIERGLKWIRRRPAAVPPRPRWSRSAGSRSWRWSRCWSGCSIIRPCGRKKPWPKNNARSRNACATSPT